MIYVWLIYGFKLCADIELAVKIDLGYAFRDDVFLRVLKLPEPY